MSIVSLFDEFTKSIFAAGMCQVLFGNLTVLFADVAFFSFCLLRFGVSQPRGFGLFYTHLRRRRFFEKPRDLHSLETSVRLPQMHLPRSF